MLLCPEAWRTYQEGGLNPHMGWASGFDGSWRRGSYTPNYWIADDDEPRYWRTPYVAQASQVPMFADSQYSDAEPLEIDVPSAHEQDIWEPGRNEMQRVCVNRHNGANAVFMDFSVRKVGLKHLWRLKWHRQWDMAYPLPVWPPWMQNFKDP